jgi:hypothetical protein
MRDWPDLPVTCFDLMYYESEALVGSMLALKREHGIPSLGVHDSLIVPASAENRGVETLRFHYFVACEADPYLDVQRPRQLLRSAPATAAFL